jgi:hypothetical protein
MTCISGRAARQPPVWRERWTNTLKADRLHQTIGTAIAISAALFGRVGEPVADYSRWHETCISLSATPDAGGERWEVDPAET